MVREGYKQTDIGVIPEDWEVVKLEEVVNFLDNLRRPIKSSERKSGEYPYYGASGVIDYVDSYIFDDELLLLGEDGENILSRNLPLVYYVNEKCWINNHAHVLKCKDKIHPFYLLNKLESLDYTNLNSGTAQPKLNKERCSNIQIPLPPLVEQEAIAAALSDADAWTESLEQVIAKKSLIIQGAMQELLTPKEDWIEYDFNKVVWFQEGPGLRNWQFTKEGIKVINVTNLENGYLNLAKTSRHISWNEFEKMYKHFEIDEGDIVVASSGNSYGKVSVVRKQDLPLVMNTSVIRFKPSDTIGYKYLLVFLKSFLFKDQIDLLITGGAQPNFGPAHLNKIKISSPKSLTGQDRIATILSDMDAELESLENQLAKARQIKQGMMQELLTGKTRLV